jgi:hypothetical protein
MNFDNNIKLLEKLKKRDDFMASIDEQLLRATKEIVVKFIEGGRISPAGFHEAFKGIYNTVAKTVKGPAEASEAESPEEQK